MGFYARQKELATLERRYATNSFECVVIYGRRRVGKTALLSTFVKGKRAAFFSALESSAEQNLSEISKAVQSLIAPEGPHASYASFGDAFAAAFACARDERTVLVVDEYPYLAEAEPSVSSVLQHAIDHNKEGSRLMLILCGSSTSFMEEQVLGKKSPLYGRRTAQMRIEPFDYEDAKSFFPQAPTQLAMELYALTGGIPRYLEELDEGLGLERNIRDAVLDPSCYLFEEPKNLLMQELRSPSSYNGVIEAMAEGASKLNEIATAAHVDSSRCSYYLRTLMSLGLVEKESPFGEDGSKRSIWKIRDSFFRFWYRFVPSNWSILQAGMLDIGTDRAMRGFPTFMGPEFERICMQWLWRRNGADLPFLMLSCGRWWGADSRSRQQEEIDIVGKGEDGRMLFCECKWKAEPTGMAQLEKLMWRSEVFMAKERAYVLFSKGGFSGDLVEHSRKSGNVRLVGLEDM